MGVCRADGTLPKTAGKCTCNVLESLTNCMAGMPGLLVQCEDATAQRGCTVTAWLTLSMVLPRQLTRCASFCTGAATPIRKLGVTILTQC